MKKIREIDLSELVTDWGSINKGLQVLMMSAVKLNVKGRVYK